MDEVGVLFDRAAVGVPVMCPTRPIVSRIVIHSQTRGIDEAKMQTTILGNVVLFKTATIYEHAIFDEVESLKIKLVYVSDSPDTRAHRIHFPHSPAQNSIQHC